MIKNPNILQLREEISKKTTFSLYKLIELINQEHPIMKRKLNLEYIYPFRNKEFDEIIESFKNQYNDASLSNFIRFLRSKDSDFSRVFSSIDISLLEKENDLVFIKENGYKLPFANNNEIFNGRESELQYINIMLNRKYKNNVILIGDPGTGKTALINQYSAITTHNIWAIELNRILSNTKYRGEFEEKITSILDEAIKHNIILFIDEIHILLRAGESNGGISASNILKPYLTRPELRIIGATTIEEFQFLHEDSALERRFNILKLKELEKDTIYQISQKLYYELGNEQLNYNEFIHIYETLNNKMKSRNFPDKIIDFLDFHYAFNLHQSKHKINFLSTLDNFISLGE